MGQSEEREGAQEDFCMPINPKLRNSPVLEILSKNWRAVQEP